MRESTHAAGAVEEDVKILIDEPDDSNRALLELRFATSGTSRLRPGPRRAMPRP
jgi:hypothetical protein